MLIFFFSTKYLKVMKNYRITTFKSIMQFVDFLWPKNGEAPRQQITKNFLFQNPNLGPQQRASTFQFRNASNG